MNNHPAGDQRAKMLEDSLRQRVDAFWRDIYRYAKTGGKS
jgi:hypothetical protein